MARWSTTFQIISAGGEGAGEDIVDVGGDDQPLDRQPHFYRAVTGEDITEIPGRHGEGDLAVRRAQGHRGGEIADDPARRCGRN